MYQRGDRVEVEGFGGDRAILRVWEVRQRGLIVCTEEDYQNALSGDGLPMALGFPFDDIREQQREDQPS